jgi:hypothetical protein
MHQRSLCKGYVVYPWPFTSVVKIGSVQPRLVGDRYPPGPLEGLKASRKALGLLFLEIILLWARAELQAEWV